MIHRLLPITDFITAALAWLLFFFYRKRVVDADITLDQVIRDEKFLIGALIISTCWVLLFWVLGLYEDIHRRRRSDIIYSTAVSVCIGCIVLLLTVLYDDDTAGYITYLRSFGVLLVIHLVLFIGSKLILLISYGRSKPFVVAIDTEQIYSRNANIDYLLPNANDQSLIKGLALHAQSSKYSQVLVSDEFIIEHQFSMPVRRSIHHSLLTVSPDVMPYWQKNCKLLLDKVISAAALIILSPLMIYAAVRTKRSSDGPIFYTQKRVGERNREFEIIKFRSMYENSEPIGPQLTQENDDRVTRWGRVMRHYRIDELPQFYNVLRGDMSLVGPRPERRYFWDQLLEDDPTLCRLLRVRPGITSLGQVRYGYASDIQQIIRRSKYERLYIDNRSLWLDLRILFSTIGIVLQGKGH